MMNPWTADRIATLSQLWADGYTCSQIAYRMGTTKNAIIGKVHRLGLPRRAVGGKVLSSAAMVPRKPSHPKVITLAPIYAASKRNQRRKVPVLVLSEPAKSMGVPIWEVTGCKWPVGNHEDGHHLFCNHKREDLRPYCPHHCEAAKGEPIKYRKRAA